MVAAVAAAAAAVAPVALSAKGHSFAATYTGHGSGHVRGTSASGSATATGRGRPIGASTLRGSASGVFISRTCVVFSGKAVLEGKTGSIRLVAHRARACAGTDANRVSFSGTAKVTGGAGKFKRARGMLSFSGRYSRRTSAVTISFRGRISYKRAGGAG